MANVLKVLLFVISSLIFLGCGNNGANSTNTNTSTQKGVFVDAPVANLKYTTNTLNGYTDYNGYAEYVEGETCTFYLGDLELGSMTCSAVMSVYEIVGDTDLNYPSQKTKNIARILQSLDENNASDRIVLDDSMQNFETPSGLSLENAIDDTTMTLILNEANTKKGGGTYSDVGEDLVVTTMKNYLEQNHPEKVSSGELSQSDAKPFELAKLTASDTEAGDYFAKAVAMSGEYIVVGAPNEDSGGNNTGSAYVFKKSGTSVSQIAKLTANNGQSFDYFGNAVAIYGSYIVIGANQEDSNGSDAGSVYVFKRNSDANITQIAKLQAEDTEAGDRFGHSVAIETDYIVIGANREDTNASNSGSAYVFKRNSDANITQLAKLKASDAQADDHFGYSTSLSGDYIAIGAQFEDTNASDAGSVYLFKKTSDSNISQIAKLQANYPATNDNFGYSISMDNNYIAISAVGKDTPTNAAGAIYLFKRESDANITQLAKITTTDAGLSDNLGYSVSLKGDYIVAGTIKHDATATNAGAAYVFKRKSDNINDIEQVSKIQARDIQAQDYFGVSVAISDNYILAGAYLEDGNTGNAGAAYFYSLFPEEKPYFSNKPSSSISIDEGSTDSIFDFKALSPSNTSITYSIEGVDANSFRFTDSNLSFSTAPDFENPTNVGSDNNYSISVVATDSSNNKASVSLNVVVQNKTYIQKTKVVANNALASQTLGKSVAMSGDYIIASAEYDSTGGNNAGAAFVFKRNADGSSSQIAKIQSSDIEAQDFFGASVAINGDYMAVGAVGEDATANSAGVLFIFLKGTLTLMSLK